MADDMRINRQPQMAQQPAPRHDMGSMGQMDNMPRANPKAPWIILGVVVVVLIVLGVLFRKNLFMGKSGSSSMTDASDYVAVFLTNGQVYFGKLSDADGQYPDLKDIYYLQVGPQQGSGTAGNAASATPQQSISLVKLGNELHGPVDEMHINRDQVLFYEQLKSDGQVVKAIQAYKATPSK